MEKLTKFFPHSFRIVTPPRPTVFRGLDWTCKTLTSKTRTSKTRTGKTRTSKTWTCKTPKNVGFINTIIYFSKNFSSENKRYHNSYNTDKSTRLII